MQTNMRALDANGGLLIEARPGTKLRDLDRAWVIEQFVSEGMLLLRGFQPDDAQFHQFSGRFAARFLVDPMPGRVSQVVAKELQTVAPGNEDLNLHYEYGITPFQPDMIWLYCSHPAPAGGETTVCDGVKIWRDLSADACRLLTETRIEYASAIPMQAWRTFFGIREYGPAARQRLTELLSPISSLKYQVDPATGMLSMQYRALAVGNGKFSATRLFTGTFLPDVYLDFPPARFEDGAEIPKWLVDEVARVGARLTIALPWQRGDVAMIDNTRWMHGRRAFQSPVRRVLSLTAYANFSAPAYTALTEPSTRAALAGAE